MRRVLCLLALLLVAPAARAEPTPEFPDALLALVPTWIAEAEAVGAPHADKPWYPEARGFLESARDAHAEGRLRSALFDLETFHELVHTGALVDEANALPSDAEGKSLILQRTGQWHGEARHAWAAYRERLDEVEDELRTVRGVEIALYSADQALGARLLMDERENVAREFPKQPGIDRGYAFALVRSSRTAILDLEWATDVLSAASAHEGLPPRLNETAWREIQAAALLPFEGNVPTHLQPFENIAVETRARNETILSIVLSLAEQRTARATSIFVIYGDATSRGKNVTADATRAMGNQLANLSMDAPRAHGLLGVFTADAIDRAQKTRAVAQTGVVDLGIVIAAWAGLDHQEYVTQMLGSASPVRPAAVETPRETPAGLAVPLAALAAAAALLARRR